MSILKEALEFVFSKAATQAETTRPKILDLPGDGRTVVVESRGVLTDRAVPPPLRNHIVRSVADITAASQRWNDSPVLWIDKDKLVLVTNDADRREFVTLPLEETRLYQTLCGLEGKELDQQDLIHLLRFDLRDATGLETMLAAVRNLRFRSGESGQSNLQHGNESLGMSVEAEVTGAGDLPETLLIGTPVFSNPGESVFSAEIELGLEINSRRRLFYLSPMPGSLEDAMHNAVENIRERVLEEIADLPIFYGSPSAA